MLQMIQVWQLRMLLVILLVDAHRNGVNWGRFWPQERGFGPRKLPPGTSPRA